MTSARPSLRSTLCGVAVALLSACSSSASTAASGPQLPAEDYSGDLAGAWYGSMSGTIDGTAIPAEPEATMIVREGHNRVSISSVCPDESGVSAYVVAPGTLSVPPSSCPPAALGACVDGSVTWSSGSGQLADGTLSIVLDGTASGCGETFAFQLVFTGSRSVPPPALSVPAIAALAPSSAVVGDPGLVLTISGSDFAPGASVVWNGRPLPVTFVSSTELAVELAAADLARAGTVWLTVSNPDGGTSSLHPFEVLSRVGPARPVPTVAAVSPASAVPGAARFTLTVSGDGFVDGTVVLWDGAARPTTVVSPRVLHAVIDAADVERAGTVAVSVFTPAPDGGRASAGTFTIAPAPPVPPRSVAWQLDPAHSGHVAFGVPLALPDAPAWSVTLPDLASYPLVAGGKVFVLTRGSAAGGQGTQLHALDLATGAVAWGPVAIEGSFFRAGHAYADGRVFVLDFDGRLRAFDAADGTPAWTVSLPGQYAFTAAPTAAGGVVYASGAGSAGTVYAVDAKDGVILWTTRVANGDESSPAVGPDGLYVSYPCQVYKLDLLTGSPIWHRSDGCSGGGGRTVAYGDGAVYVRDPSRPSPLGAILDAFDGSTLGAFGAVGSPIPAVGADARFVVAGGALERWDHGAPRAAWTFAADPQLDGAPIVIDGLVVVGSASGTLHGVDAVTGAEVWSAAAGAPIYPPAEYGAYQPVTGLGAGEGYLVAPAGRRVTAWRLATMPAR